MLKQIKNKKTSKIALELVENLKQELEIEEIAQKLASMLYSANDVEGSDKIGKNITEVDKLFKYMKTSSDNKKRGRNRGGRDRNSNRHGRRNNNRRNNR